MRRRRSYRWPLGVTLVVAAVAATFLVVPTVAAVPARVVEGGATWIATATGFELLSAGGLVGPTVGAWSASTEKPSLSQLARSTIIFAALTNAPGAVVLAAFGTLLWLGLPSGPHQAALTILPALIAVGLLGSTWFAGRTSQAHPPAQRQRTSWRALAKPTAAVSAS